MLAISRGVPWLVHAFGRALCEALPRNAATKIIDAAVWARARKRVLRELGEALKVPVDAAAKRQDEKWNVSPETQPQAALQGNLWRLLCDAAQKVKPITQDFNGDNWPDETQSITIEQLQNRLPQANRDAVRKALSELAASAALEGEIGKAGEYRFAHHLLPTWLYYSQAQGVNK